MARRKQLINLHSTVVKNPTSSTVNPEIAVGEIVIQAVKTAATIYSKVEDGSYAEFIDKTQIQSLISGASSALSDRLDTVEGNIQSISGTLETTQTTANDALQSVSVSAVNGYVTTTASTKSGDPAAKSQEISIEAHVAGEISGVSATGQLADAYYVKAAIAAEAQSRGDKDTALENSISALTENFNNAVSGIGYEQGSIKDYVDGQVSHAISSVYRVKGSVDKYSDLADETGLTVGDVYNVVSAATVDGKWYPAGTNFVYMGEDETTHAQKWDALGGTFDLSPYAYASALTAEAQTRSDADDAINAKIGGTYTSANTVHDAITAATQGADNSLKSVSATGANAYVSAVAGSVSGEAGSKTQEITVTANVSSDIESETAAGKLADAFDVKTLINAATAATQSVDDDLADLKKLVGDNTATTSSHTMTDAIAYLEGNALQQVIATGDDYVSAVTSKTTTSETITISSNVSNDISGVTSGETKLADAFAVKKYVETLVSGITSDANALADKVDNLKEVLGENSAYTSGHTVTDALKELEDNAVKTINVAASTGVTSTNVTVSKSGNTVTLNFEEMVIDCGEY